MIALVVALAVPLQLAGGPPTIQPRTLSSPSGEWTAHLDPSSKFGEGPSEIEARHGGDVVWSASLPFSFWEAEITDEGAIAGYAFTAGRRGQKWDELGELIVSIIGPDGRERLHESVERRRSQYLHGSPDPRPKGLFAQPTLDCFVVRVADEDVNRDDEEWWVYRVTTGEALGRVHPKGLLASPEGVRSSLEARAIVGTSLTLVQWYQIGREPTDPQPGTRFVLVGEDWKPVWTLELARDYFSFDRDEADRLRDEAWQQGGILAADEPRRFDLRHVSAKERVTYEIAADASAASGWAVSKVARSAYVEPSGPDTLARLDLQEIATVPLQAGARREVGPVHDIEAFDVLPDGSVRFVRREAGGGVALLSLDAEGAVVHEAHVGELAPAAEDRRAWHPLGEDRWLFTVSPFGDGALSRAWLVDGSGTATEVEHFAGPSITAVRPAPDGGFVVIGSYHHHSSMSDALIALDRAGARRWEHLTDSYSGDPAELMGVDDLAVEGDGTALVLDNVRQAVLVFDADGKYDRTVKLALAAEGRDRPYLTALRIEPSGSWLVRDFRKADPCWHRVDRDGQRLGGFEMQREDGSRDVAFDREVLVDAQGGLWATDGQALYILDETGRLHPRFGLMPEATSLEEPTFVTFDDRGRVAVVDRRSHAVHLFAASGARELVLQPAAEDVADLSSIPTVIATPDDRILVEGDFFRRVLSHEFRPGSRFLAFAADQRAGWVDFQGDQIAFCPDGGSWLAEGSQSSATGVIRLDAAGERGQTLARRPDGAFYLSVDALDCEPDGSLWVLTGAHQGELELDRYSPAGEPTRTIELHQAPGRWWNDVHAAGPWVLVTSFSDGAILVSADGGQPSLIGIDPSAKDKSCAFTLSPEGTELWFATIEPLALHRYALPVPR